MKWERHLQFSGHSLKNQKVIRHSGDEVRREKQRDRGRVVAREQQSRNEGRMAYIKDTKEDWDRQFGSSRERQRTSADRIQTEVAYSCLYSYACRGNPGRTQERIISMDDLYGKREVFERGDGKYRKFVNETWNAEERWDVQTLVDKQEQLTILEPLTLQKLFCSNFVGKMCSLAGKSLTDPFLEENSFSCLVCSVHCYLTFRLWASLKM